MNQIEASKARPYFSVGFQYERNPWTVWSFTEYWQVLGNKAGGKNTMSGTDDESIARRAAEWCVTQPGIKFAWVHKTVDCYNHEEVCKVEARPAFASV